ncbi:tetratricopeptide repeat protein [Metabacillus herbersteinensis]|uniref:Tetratricopeptide repeat protein n=1 Tax=Metabacillus herbersteinensis TaxID=283816 RepID=A0ABV6GHT0_9BACI
MEIGSRIRFYRIQQNMTQEALSKSIISTSYLSKIENNQTTASIEVLDCLCERLKIQLIEEEEITLMKSLFDWYDNIAYRNLDAAKKQYKELQVSVKKSSDTSAFIYFVLFEFRYFLLIQEYVEAEELLGKIHLFRDIFEDKMTYYYEKFVGVFHYVNGKYNVALGHMKNAERFLTRHLSFEKWEEADLYYSISLCCSQLRKHSLGIQYANLALHINQSNYELNRCAECHMLLGINYQREEEYQRSSENYDLAMKVSELLNDLVLEGKIYHNYGYLYSAMEKYEEAINYFIKGISIKGTNNNQPKSLSSILGIINAYYKLARMEECKTWLEEGQKVLNEQFNEEYSIHFRIYHFLVNKEFKNQYEEFLTEIAIPYFLTREKHNYIIEYAEGLAKYFEEIHKYKSASYYYQIVMNALKKQSQINY